MAEMRIQKFSLWVSVEVSKTDHEDRKHEISICATDSWNENPDGLRAGTKTTTSMTSKRWSPTEDASDRLKRNHDICRFL